MSVPPPSRPASGAAKGDGAPASDTPTGWNLSPLDLMLVFIPVAAVLEYTHAAGAWVFLTAGLAIIPLAGLMGRATEALAEHIGSAAGGLLNATFGNAAELIIALMVLARGPELHSLVKASITGSIIGNLLLVFGLSMLFGGFRHRRQEFDRTAAGVGTTLLALACIGLIVPTLFFYWFRANGGPTPDQTRTVEHLSEEIAAVLAVVYLLSLLFTLRTHRHLAAGKRAEPPSETDEPERKRWGVRTALLVLLAATAGVALLSEWLVGAVEPAAHALGMNTIFVGVIVVAIIGNAAEHSTAVLMAWKNRMDLAAQIAVGSSTQVALFVAPVLVFASMLMGHQHPLDLHFTLLEVAALLLSVFVIALVCHDGETHWLEGVMLLAVYLIFALAFYHLEVR